VAALAFLPQVAQVYVVLLMTVRTG